MGDYHEGSLLGIGYHHAPSNNISSPSSPSVPPSDAIDILMQQYLQQCLEYHEEQQTKRNQAGGEGPVSFIPASYDHDVKKETQGPEIHFNETTNLASIQENNSLVNNSTAVLPADVEGGSFHQQPMVGQSQSHEAQVLEARARAQAILEKFQRQREKLLFGTMAVPLDESLSDLQGVPPSIFRAQRDLARQREEERKHRSLLKNLEYIAEKDSQRIQLLATQIGQAHTEAERAELRYLATVEERKRLRAQSSHEEARRLEQLKSRAGVGTHQRKKVEKSKSKDASRKDNSVAIYISGLPIDGSVTEDFIEQLFASYGTILKVRFYCDKDTSELKGDGLVIYQCDGEQRALLETVCSQMNLAELPCGSQLRVEPAHSSYKFMDTRTEPSTRADSVAVTADPEMATTAPAATEDEELDDFFSAIDDGLG